MKFDDRMLSRVQLGVSLIAAVSIALLIMLNAELQRRRDEAVRSMQDSTVALVVEVRSVQAMSKAGVDSILATVRDRATANRELARALASTIRREVRAVHATVDSVQDQLPALNKKGRQ